MGSFYPGGRILGVWSTIFARQPSPSPSPNPGEEWWRSIVERKTFFGMATCLAIALCNWAARLTKGRPFNYSRRHIPPAAMIALADTSIDSKGISIVFMRVFNGF
ncbi:MAG: hypothetical protein OXI91_15380 [Chloroflexota bacterium]|nr:hypothetical protein [Chloroflexota bacterium]